MTVPAGRMLSANLGGAIRKGAPMVVLGEVTADQAGALTLRVVVCPRGGLAPGRLLRVPTLRAAPGVADRQGFNHWNRLPLAPGMWLALAGCLLPPDVLLAEAGREAGPPETHAPGLDRAVAMADEPAGFAYAPALAQALAEDDVVCLAILLGLAASDARLPRATAVQGLASVLERLPSDSANADGLADALISSRLLDTDAGADPANRRIVACLATRLLAGDAAMLPFLASALLREMDEDPVRDAAVRAGFLTALPERARLAARLAAEAPEERARMLGLIEALRK